MKRLFAFVVAAALMVGAASVYAGGDGCCMAGKKAKGDAKQGCSDMFSKLNLTDAQKAKVSALMERCEGAASTAERREMFSKGIQDILTPEQFAQWKADCEKMKASGECPFMKGEKRS